MCKKYNLNYSAHIVTNGRYLSADYAKRLYDKKVGSAQISIDGLSEIYQKNKGASEEDFKAVIENLKASSGLISITVRINIFPEEFPEAKKLTQYLLKDEKLDGKIRMYIANKRDYSADPSVEQKRFGEYCELDKTYRNLFKQNEYSSGSYQYRKVYQISTPCVNVCNSSLCIGPKGELYKCEHHFGDPHMIIGNIVDGYYCNSLSRQIMGVSLPTEGCKDCPYLPCCMGGCPDDRRTNRFIINCERYTKRLDDLKLFELEFKDYH